MREDELRGKYVGGAVTNWTLVSLNHDTQMCMDPNVLESKVMVSSTGHDGPMGASGQSPPPLTSCGFVQDCGLVRLQPRSPSCAADRCFPCVGFQLQNCPGPITSLGSCLSVAPVAWL